MDEKQKTYRYNIFESFTRKQLDEYCGKEVIRLITAKDKFIRQVMVITVLWLIAVVIRHTQDLLFVDGELGYNFLGICHTMIRLGVVGAWGNFNSMADHLAAGETQARHHCYSDAFMDAAAHSPLLLRG